MIVISDNLRGLVTSCDICAIDLVEEFSLRIMLGRKIRRMRRDMDAAPPLVYGISYEVAEYFEASEPVRRDLVLRPGERILACSDHIYRMPDAYLGFVQTKGSLARLFVAATCNDGQIEPGYRGRITLELMNHAHFPVTIPVGANIAQMFVQRCSMIATAPYDGRYQDADEPTIAVFEPDRMP